MIQMIREVNRAESSGMRALLLTLVAMSAPAASHQGVVTPTTAAGVRILDTPAPADDAGEVGEELRGVDHEDGSLCARAAGIR